MRILPTHRSVQHCPELELEQLQGGVSEFRILASESFVPVPP